MALWEGRFKKELDIRTNDFNSSIKFDSRMYMQDITGSIAHTKMLAKQKIIEEENCTKILKGLQDILQDLQTGVLKIDSNAEDIHSFVENELTIRIGDSGKKLHTARSRNDQVALDIRMYLKDEIQKLIELLKELIDVLVQKSEKNLDTVMPGYTHLQRAQPITFAHHLMAYVEMFIRDIDRLNDCYKRTNIMPLRKLCNSSELPITLIEIILKNYWNLKTSQKTV